MAVVGTEPRDDTPVEQYDYDLPDAAIAQTPIEPRDSARLLVDRGPGREPEDRVVRHLPGLVGPGDLVVVNDSRVIPARLRLEKSTGGQVEVLLLESRGERSWTAMVRPARRLPPGTVLFHAERPVLEVTAIEDDLRLVTFLGDGPVDEVLARIGEMPLPPYIHTGLDDPDRYQTVYADRAGSAAAPTAGLHLTDRVLDGLREAGAQIETVELRVGLDTFGPLRGPTLAEQVMHTEAYRVPEATLDAVAAADRVIAVGTTTVRALESVTRFGPEGRTDLFIRPGFDFSVVDAMVTNFHVPRSTLLVMLEAFMGERWRDLYGHALEQGYRFLSFGDAMLVPSQGLPSR